MLDSDRHINSMVSDYVLDLLPLADQRLVARHIAACVTCRKAVLRERQIGLAVKRTLSMATDVDELNLAQKMPRVSRQNRFEGLFSQGQRHIVLACCLLILAVASIGVQLRLQQNKWMPTAPAMLSTVIMITETPTPTLLATSDGSIPSDVISPTPETGHSIALPEAALAPAASSPSLQ